MAAAFADMALADLRRQVRAIEQPFARLMRSVVPFELADIDAHLPWRGLPRGAVHELAGPFADAAAAGFALALIGKLGAQPFLWCRLRHRALPPALPYGPGLKMFGLAHERVIFVETSDRADALWVAEESLKAGGLAAVYVEGLTPDLTESRRLQLAAETMGVTVFLQTPPGEHGPSAALTRWHLQSLPHSEAPLWRVALERCRGGAPSQWTVTWHEPTLSFRLAAALSH